MFGYNINLWTDCFNEIIFLDHGIKKTGTVIRGDIRGFSTVFLYNEIEAKNGQTTTTN